jgi:transcriptional regulator with XRE-family HTH domain
MSSQLNTIKLADMLKSKRGAKGLRAVAEEIGGVSAPTLSRIEQGNIPDVDTFIKICKWLEVPTDFFTNKSEANAPSSSDVVVAHLRADKALPPDVSEALIKMINLAYESYK